MWYHTHLWCCRLLRCFHAVDRSSKNLFALFHFFLLRLSCIHAFVTADCIAMLSSCKRWLYAVHFRLLVNGSNTMFLLSFYRVFLLQSRNSTRVSAENIADKQHMLDKSSQLTKKRCEISWFWRNVAISFLQIVCNRKRTAKRARTDSVSASVLFHSLPSCLTVIVNC